jgi:hypothetical protein
LKSDRAIEVSLLVVRTFVQLRQILSTNAELSRKLVAMEKNYDIKFKAIFEAIHQLMTPPTRKRNAPSALHRGIKSCKHKIKTFGVIPNARAGRST